MIARGRTLGVGPSLASITAGQNTFTAKQTFTATNDNAIVVMNTLTGANAQAAAAFSAVWNTSGTPTAITLDVTDTASNAASLLLDLRVGGVSQFAISKSGVVSAPRFQAFSSGILNWGTRARMLSPADGQITLTNAAQTDFSLLQFGGTTSAFPAIKRNGIAIDFRLADDSTYAPVRTGLLQLDGIATLRSDAADIVAQRNGVSAQTLRVYNTYTDASNYERGAMDWATNANSLTIGTQAAGTGSGRPVIFVRGGAAVMTLFVSSMIQLSASTTAKSHLNLVSGVAPTTPNNGDIWFDGTNLKMQIGGTTKTFTIV